MGWLRTRIVARWQSRCTHDGSVVSEKIGGDWRIGWVYWCERCGAVSIGACETEATFDMSRPNARGEAS